MSLLLGLIVLFVFAFAIVIAVRWICRENATRGESALEVLKKRYARDEISKNEYERIKADIR